MNKQAEIDLLTEYATDAENRGAGYAADLLNACIPFFSVTTRQDFPGEIALDDLREAYREFLDRTQRQREEAQRLENLITKKKEEAKNAERRTAFFMSDLDQAIQAAEAISTSAAREKFYQIQKRREEPTA